MKKILPELVSNINQILNKIEDFFGSVIFKKFIISTNMTDINIFIRSTTEVGVFGDYILVVEISISRDDNEIMEKKYFENYKDKSVIYFNTQQEYFDILEKIINDKTKDK